MKQVIQNYKKGQVKLEETPVPLCKAGGVLARNACSLISPGTEKFIIETGRKNLLDKALARPDLVRLSWEKAKKEGFWNVFNEAMNRLDEPVALGYSSAGVVVETGEKVSNFSVGDRVACAGAGFASHADYVWVPENLCASIPEGVSFEEASFVMLGAIALQGIRCAELSFGENAAVIGLGLIGLITIQILETYGCKVIGFDIDKRKCELAGKISPGVLVVKDTQLFKKTIEQATKGYGTDAAIITASSKDNSALLLAEEICRKKGTVVLVGMADIALTRKTMWEKELKFIVSKAAGPGSIEENYEKKGFDYPVEYARWTEKRNMEEFLSLAAKRKVDVKRLITHSFSSRDALCAYELITKNEEFYVGILLKYREEIPKETKVNLGSSFVHTTSSKGNIGVIGGGLFSKNVLLPVLRKIKGINLIGIATTSGCTSFHTGKKFGFQYCTTDYKKILEDESINSVIITTPHNLHAAMVIEAIKAGKNVFVEKPLCIRKEQLQAISDTYGSLNEKPKLMVGFNRPFSPLSQKAKDFIKDRSTPLVINYRVNAGYIPQQHWTRDLNVGGGRIIGEVCHFIDFLQFLTGAYPISVFTQGIDGNTGKYFRDDNIVITLKFRDGSIGTILYSSKGSKSFSRERVEVFCEDSLAIIEDFRKLLLVEGNKKRAFSKFSQEMGYREELSFFIESNELNGKIFEGYVNTMYATFAALESLQKDRVIEI